MKPLPWVTLLLAGALPLLGRQAFGQRTPESARAETELLELRQSLADLRSQLDDLSKKVAEAFASQRKLALRMESSLADIRQELAGQKASGAGSPAEKRPRGPLFGGLLEPGVEFAAGTGGSKKHDPDLIQALKEQLHLLDDCFKRAWADYGTGTLSAHDFHRVGYELHAAKAELAWAQGDANAALRALEEALVQADHELKAWRAREAQGLQVREGALDRRVAAVKRRVEAARALARVKRALGRKPGEAAAKQKAGPSPGQARQCPQGPAKPASDLIEALREHVRLLDEGFERVEAERRDTPHR